MGIITNYNHTFPAPEKPYTGPTFDRSGSQVRIQDYLEAEARQRLRRSEPRQPKPFTSNTKGKLTEPETPGKYEVKVDWLRMSGPVEVQSLVLQLMGTYFGDAVLGKGRFFLSSSYRWGNASYFYDECGGKAHALVELPATALSELTSQQVQKLMSALLQLGFRATRIDIAIDMAHTPNLIDTVVKSCQAGELCRSRRFQPMEQRTSNHLTAHGCNIGARGNKGSGRYLRIYDKGLETKTEAVGEWVRWEAELSDEPAQEAALAIAQSKDYQAVAIGYAFGVCDFREVTGSKHLDRRPRCKWFEELLQDIEPQRAVKTKPKSTLHSFRRWMQRAVLPKLETLRSASRLPMDQLIVTLFELGEPDPHHLDDPKVRQLLIEAGGDPTEAMMRLGHTRQVVIPVIGGSA